MSPRPRTLPSRRSRFRPRLRAARLVAVCLTVLVPAAPAAAVTSPGATSAAHGDDATLRGRLEAFVRAPGGPPGAIVVLQRGPHTRVVRAGVADLVTGRPPGPDDHMRIASVAKAFSGAVALSLVDRQDLSLDDALKKRLPQLPRHWGSVTLRQLLQHTSGLPDFTESPEFLKLLAADPHHRFDSRKLLDFVADKKLRFRPGARYHYSNSDNIAVALMAEAVTGTTYEKLLSELVYRPLGLRSTSLPSGYRLPEPALHGYDLTDPASPEDVSELFGASGVWASGGIVSTPADVTRFIRGYASGALYGGKEVLAAQRNWIAGASEPPGPGADKAGLAIFRYTTRCGEVLGHTGNIPGYTQLIAATPDGERSLTFTVTSQVNQSLAPERLRELRTLQEDFVCALLKEKR
ncbi:serine hydrolase domain-containing protein [Streptomyces sp. NPDC056716]|uniref:serine hydrolase domain-containing protein n=1 Tax=unclassified Streptomyces TaxID=2593676 RepID=UPI0036859093